jgi:hypothetical protein
LSTEQGEVYIRGRKRGGLISDDEISGLRIGLVSFRVMCDMLILICYYFLSCNFICLSVNRCFKVQHFLIL